MSWEAQIGKNLLHMYVFSGLFHATVLTGQEIHRFLHALRSLVRGRNAVAIITLPPSFIRNQDEDAIKRLSWAVDASLEIKGFAGEHFSTYMDSADVQTILRYNQSFTLSTVYSHSIPSPTLTSSHLLSNTPPSSASHQAEAVVRITWVSVLEERDGESRLFIWGLMVE